MFLFKYFYEWWGSFYVKFIGILRILCIFNINNIVRKYSFRERCFFGGKMVKMGYGFIVCK